MCASSVGVITLEAKDRSRMSQLRTPAKRSTVGLLLRVWDNSKQLTGTQTLRSDRESRLPVVIGQRATVRFRAAEASGSVLAIRAKYNINNSRWNTYCDCLKTSISRIGF